MKQKIPYSQTSIPRERTKADIEQLLSDYHVEGIQWTTYRGESSLRFIWKVQVKGVEKEIMFQFKPPWIETRKRVWSQSAQRSVKATVQLENTAYRLLWHYLKNKLEAVRWGMETIEKEFLSHAVVALPNGEVTTVGENIMDVLETVRSPALSYTPTQEKENKIIDV